MFQGYGAHFCEKSTNVDVGCIDPIGTKGGFVHYYLTSRDLDWKKSSNISLAKKGCSRKSHQP